MKYKNKKNKILLKKTFLLLLLINSKKSRKINVTGIIKPNILEEVARAANKEKIVNE